VRARLLESGWDVCIVVSAGRVVLGMVSTDAVRVDPATPIESVMKPAPRTFRPNYGVAALSSDLRRQRLTRALVTTSDGALIGLVRLADADVPEEDAPGPWKTPGQAEGERSTVEEELRRSGR
jgi:predicted transcriptional regulator